ncbi:MAG: 4-(cytidine 5'-diphospho)-2-C-methyl-D-erythritol kinase [Pseudomonadota bacterium]|nr:4-(cytidine 5'-diphospho)-2-C-methyl-D-erythritol kinase [Pseudomonadota bacterium]
MTRWPAPAKLNLFLHITGRRADGYHALQTVFQLLDYGDELEFDRREDGLVTRVNPLPGVPAETDLCVRAARLLQQTTGVAGGVDIRLDKQLPMGGGLGGGSSDAATTLLALNGLWGCDLPREELAGLGATLGADIPVFVTGHSAWGEGVGEKLSPLVLPPRWYVVIAPAVEISTAELFAAPELTRNCERIRISEFLAGAGTNVFEDLVRERHADVSRALDWLDSRGGSVGPARLTGTGSCVFSAYHSANQAAAVADAIPGKWKGFAARGIDRSPVEALLRAGE